MLYFPVIGNSVQSEKSFVSGDYGQKITLNCTYSTSSSSTGQSYIFWYRQYPNQMQYLLHRGLKSYGNIKYEGKFPSGKFHSETSDTHAHLTITSLTQEDSALYLCAFSDGAQTTKVCHLLSGNVWECSSFTIRAIQKEVKTLRMTGELKSLRLNSQTRKILPFISLSKLTTTLKNRGSFKCFQSGIENTCGCHGAAIKHNKHQLGSFKMTVILSSF
uniref:Ig-like domain-containing protein n=1 Tax=Leptobrachium leishanense TaxID=445787 RepID=A0A8C5M741_9ANUR